MERASSATPKSVSLWLHVSFARTHPSALAATKLERTQYGEPDSERWKSDANRDGEAGRMRPPFLLRAGRDADLLFSRGKLIR